jgi:uncharacterized protein YybS (DUF2232 family)
LQNLVILIRIRISGNIIIIFITAISTKQLRKEKTAAEQLTKTQTNSKTQTQTNNTKPTKNRYKIAGVAAQTTGSE